MYLTWENVGVGSGVVVSWLISAILIPLVANDEWRRQSLHYLSHYWILPAFSLSFHLPFVWGPLCSQINQITSSPILSVSLVLSLYSYLLTLSTPPTLPTRIPQATSFVRSNGDTVPLASMEKLSMYTHHCTSSANWCYMSILGIATWRLIS